MTFPDLLQTELYTLCTLFKFSLSFIPITSVPVEQNPTDQAELIKKVLIQCHCIDKNHSREA